MEKISIKELKQEISDEVHSIGKIVQKEASIIEDQILKEKLDNIEKGNKDEHDVVNREETKGIDEDEKEQEIVSLVDATKEDNVEEISKDKVEENNEEISVEEKDLGKIILLVNETEDNTVAKNEEINTEDRLKKWWISIDKQSSAELKDTISEWKLP